MDNSNQLWKVILRWIAVLPASVFGMVVTFALLRIIYNIGASSYFDTNSWLSIFSQTS